MKHKQANSSCIPVFTTVRVVITKWGDYITFNIPTLNCSERYSATALCQIPVNSRAHKSKSKDECQYGQIFEPGDFLILLHNVTPFGIDNSNKCHIMQIRQKSLRFGYMTILTPIF